MIEYIFCRDSISNSYKTTVFPQRIKSNQITCSSTILLLTELHIIQFPSNVDNILDNFLNYLCKHNGSPDQERRMTRIYGYEYLIQIAIIMIKTKYYVLTHPADVIVPFE